MEYKKDFDGWNKRKKEINSLERGPFFYEGEIWWSSYGINVGTEMDGKNDLFERPILIIKKINEERMLAVPLTYVSLSQIREIDSKRLIRCDGRISLKEYAHIIIRIKYLFTF